MSSPNPQVSVFAKASVAGAVLGTVALAALPAQAQESNLNWPDSLHFANTEISGLTQLQRQYGPFRKALSDVLVPDVEFTPVPNRTAAAEALRTDKVDIVFTGPAEYVAIRAQTEVRPVIGLTRPGYRSVIAVRSDSDIDSVADLQGKQLLMEEIGSTSAHLGPTMLLNEAGLEPDEDVQVRMVGDNFMHAFANGQGDALGAGAHDVAFMRDEYGSDKFRVIKEGEDLPNDLFMAPADMPDSLAAHIQEAFLANEQKLLDAIVSVEANRKYSDSGFTEVDDAEYDPILKAYRKTGISDFGDGA